MASKYNPSQAVIKVALEKNLLSTPTQNISQISLLQQLQVSAWD